MSISVSFGYTSDPVNKISKTYEEQGTVTCELKTGTSVESPTFIVTGSGVPRTANYAHCAGFGRYYYITDITLTPEGWYVTCTSDPLMSFSAEILALPVLAERNENTSQSYLPDASVATYNKMRVKYSHFNGGELHKTSDGADRFILILA
jgi:hypothetical protein